MKKLLLVALMMFAAVPAWSATPYVDRQQAAAQVEHQFSAILDLWRDGRLEELYEETVPAAMSKEKFVRTLGNAACRPACCWEKLQDVKVTVEGVDTARIHARVGLDSPTGVTEFATRSFHLVSDGSRWKVQASDLVSLSGGAGGTPKRLKKGAKKR